MSLPLRTSAFSALSAFAVLAAHAQAPMGTISTRDASVTGSITAHADNATLLSNANITAAGHTATISLSRGGATLVCATSQFHLLHSGAGNSLLFGLDRGAIQIASPTEPQDVILTPDIRFTIEHPGQFDLRLRVTPNGDTCVDNAGPNAPVLALTDAFSEATYRLMPGQHVLFEHGDLHQVVDNERSPCGCPEPDPTPQPITASATPAQRAAAEHPFPAAASQGLTPEAPPPPPEPTPAHSTTDFHINAGDTTAVALTTTPPPPASTAEPTSLEPPPAPPGADDLVHIVGRFFKRLFHKK